MGYFYYGNYAKLYEIGRVEWLRSLGITYRDMEDLHKIIMPVVSMESKYMKPAYYDDLLTIVTSIRELPTYSITFHHEIYNEQQKRINVGSVRLCFVDINTRRLLEIPDFLAHKMKGFFS
jgi:acyl-CoA thioester hydrolase